LAKGSADPRCPLKRPTTSRPRPPPLPGQLAHHYELSNAAAGVASFRHLVEAHGDAVTTKAHQRHSLYLHPSPVFHLRRLLGDLLQGVPAAHGARRGFDQAQAGRAGAPDESS
jgi:hypothetical protein